MHSDLVDLQSVTCNSVTPRELNIRNSEHDLQGFAQETTLLSELNPAGLQTPLNHRYKRFAHETTLTAALNPEGSHTLIDEFKMGLDMVCIGRMHNVQWSILTEK